VTSSTATSSKQTAGMRSPFVRLEPSGKGHALFEGQAQHDIEASQLIYIPPATRYTGWPQVLHDCRSGRREQVLMEPLVVISKAAGRGSF